MAFGLSGAEDSSRMEGADVAVAYMDDTRGYATDYNITAKAPVRIYKRESYCKLLILREGRRNLLIGL